MFCRFPVSDLLNFLGGAGATDKHGEAPFSRFELGHPLPRVEPKVDDVIHRFLFKEHPAVNFNAVGAGPLFHAGV